MKTLQEIQKLIKSIKSEETEKDNFWLILEEINKGRKADPIGTVRNNRKKMPDGTWQYIKKIGQKQEGENKDQVGDSSEELLREQAIKAYKKMKEEEYAFARESKFSNKGEDLAGSARHKRGKWKDLQTAEKDGTAEALVTREKLLKNEPISFMEEADKNPLNALITFEAVSKFPPRPDTKNIKDDSVYFIEKTQNGGTSITAYETRGQEIIGKITGKEYKQKIRKEYVETFEKIKKRAKELASSDIQDPKQVLSELKETVADIMRTLRQENYYNTTANQLVKYYNHTLNAYKTSKTSIGGTLKDLYGPLKKKHQDGEIKNTQDFAQYIKDYMEGKSISDILGGEKKKKKRFSRSEMYVNYAERKGPDYKDLGTAEEQEDFLIQKAGLRGLQWGNSVTDDERKHHLEKLSYALKDLGDVLGMPEKMISFNGKLGMAIGARGKASAMAHYERVSRVINLTRSSGVGSLAHEWGHMFDNILNEMIGRSYADFLSSATYTDNSIEKIEKMVESKEYTEEQGELIKTMIPLQQEMGRFIRGDLFQSSVYKEAGQSKREYLGSYHEVFARSFEIYIDKKLTSKGRKNTYLSGLDHSKVNKDSVYPSPERMEKMEPLFDAFFEKFKNSSYLQKSFNNYLDLLTNKENNKMSEKTTKEIKDLIKSIISELPEKLDENSLIKSYEKAKTILPSGEAVQLIKSIVDKKYPKVKAVPNKSELFKASESNYHIDIENLKEMTNEVLDFNQWDEDLTQEQQILKSNIEKIKPFETE